jgi:hypothetical protein
MGGVSGGSGVALKRSNTSGRVELTGGVIEECHKTVAVLLSPVVLALRASVPTAVLSFGILFSSAK